MPLPRAIEQVVLPFEGRSLEVGIVRYRGSFHLVVDLKLCPLDPPAAERLARLLGVASDEALVGVMLYQPATRELTPLIYLPALDSLIWEQGCGSGSASLGSYLAWRQEAPIQLDLVQPGGTIGVTAACSGHRLASVRIKSRVSIVATGTAYVRARACLHTRSGAS
jgi:diaminopimelate epimerase